MQRVQRLLGGGVVFQSVGCIQFLRHRRFLFVGKMIQHIPALQSRALARWPQERGFRLTGGFRHYAGVSVRSIAPSPAPPHRTVREVFPHTALREPSPGGIQLVCTIRP